ncbi:protease SohB [Saccharospirillum sp. MSK14-1]|uniref:protease SohB n=1 Tax=Saccharospirillum sp. MSK14-1 TaxID=1897632 RepID=UPI000D3D828E|nr:protease SohB [Saccharospirillum sp. MSK14-1]PTY36695.1 protease SohB [Saccharospirillum sp. MSK14-1]
MWSDYWLFLLKALTVTVVIIVIIGAIARNARSGQSDGQKGRLVVRKLNERFHRQADAIRHQVFDKKALKAHQKEEKARKKADKDKTSDRVWVLTFKGDIQASQVSALREEITALLAVAKAGEEVVLVLESPGGAVSGYGLAASQLMRLRDAGLTLTVCVDKVAASGGYMMACIADRIMAAPFAIVGSIGVLAQVPNVHNLLKKHDVDVEVLTAGKHKAPLTLMGEKTEAGRQKFVDDLEAIHRRFKGLVGRYRPQLELDKVTEGDFWLAEDALELQLIDEIGTSDDYLQKQVNDKELVGVTWKPQRHLNMKVRTAASAATDGFINRLSQRILP